MKVLLDECIDWRLWREIVGHQIRTARQMGWSTIRSGVLLGLAAKEFEVFITVNRNLSFQQNVPAFAIAVVVLRAPTNRHSYLLPLVPGLLARISNAKAGSVAYVGARPAAEDLDSAAHGTQVRSAAHPLKNKDVIELAGVRMEFVNAPAV